MSTKHLSNYAVHNDFKTDLEVKGKFAEEDFINFFYSRRKNKGKIIFDVRQVTDYKEIDVDFVVDNLGGMELPILKEVNYHDERYIKVEAKFDGKGLTSGNLPYEMVSHSKPGWAAFSECNYLYFALCEETNNPNERFIVRKRALVDFKKWKKFLRKQNNNKMTINEDEKVVIDFLTKMDVLEREGILRYM